MSKIASLNAFIKGMHVMSNRPEDGLRDYHAAKAALGAARKRDLSAKREAIATALKNYRVTVALWAGTVSISRTLDGDGNRLACPQSIHL